jgi:tetratricopeptide (TPR) repeat protein
MATPDAFLKAIEFFEQAIGLEKEYALAYAGLATSYNYLGWMGAVAREVYPKAQSAALKALEIDEMLAEAHNELGYTALNYDWDWAAAEGYLERAIELNPNSSQAFLHYSWYLLSQLRVEEAHAAITRASELDPLSIIIHINQPNYYHFIGDFDTMLKMARRTLEIAPYAVTALLNAGWAYCEKGLFEDASTQFEVAVELTGSGMMGLLAFSYAMSGRTNEAKKILDTLREPAEGEFIRPMQIALVYVGLNQFDEAFIWLDRAYKERSSPLLVYLRTLPMFHPLREDPRYIDLERRLSFQQ